MSIIFVGIGAGLVSALLFAVVITGSPLAVLLSYVAPLPIIIAALGWNHRSGLLAAAIGGLATAAIFSGPAALAFFAGSALPGWWLAYLALLGRAQDGSETEWYPVGRLLVWIALLSALITLAGSLALGAGDYEAYRGVISQAMESVLQVQTRSPGAPPAASMLASPEFAQRLADVVPFIASTVFALILVLNVWIAAKVVSISQRLPRPWPVLADAVMPRGAVGLLAGSALLAFLPGYAGLLGLALVGGFVMAFALQGLAVVHTITRGKPARTGILLVTYMLALFVGHTVIPLLAVAGVADSGLGLRHRFPPAGSPPSGT